jgi:hypothetical protein
MISQNGKAFFAFTMPEKNTQLRTNPVDLHERPITLDDGRYMVFFTFTDDKGRDLSEGLHPWNPDPLGLEPTEARGV